jgi:hypothetical protein
MSFKILFHLGLKLLSAESTAGSCWQLLTGIRDFWQKNFRKFMKAAVFRRKLGKARVKV